ncbi:mitochondrial pyruvate dehydrogenase kinase [Reticulomyxa filosa]|uniref:Protein-serine/threonine kinase n=1 Tax=Reticulomyxa filosa TaxID=46433 RepID=X6NKP2_RETFI|nr:mitochondrial pyruvate dehydrogenase kinase [Reticulomyxa filosa]|eukprot:ETO25922.1 mitochondrial pyruvate dehydrogenase kinase [Reticulomyxa filosa]
MFKQITREPGICLSQSRKYYALDHKLLESLKGKTCSQRHTAKRTVVSSMNRFEMSKLLCGKRKRSEVGVYSNHVMRFMELPISELKTKADSVIHHHADNKATKLSLKQIVEFNSPERFLERVFFYFLFFYFIFNIKKCKEKSNKNATTLLGTLKKKKKKKGYNNIFFFFFCTISKFFVLLLLFWDMMGPGGGGNSILKLRNMYQHSFYLIRSLPNPTDESTLASFVQGVDSHFKSLANATELLSSGIKECTATHPSQAPQVRACKFLNSFLDRFHLSRIGTRLLTGQLCALYAEYYNNDGSAKVVKNTKSGCLGLLDHNCSPREVLQWAVDDASRMCHENYGKIPEVNIYDEQDIRFTYIPTHLHYILLELLKNSMRATCEHHKNVHENLLPSIDAVIVASAVSKDITIKLCDQGGGIPQDQMDKIWLYSFSTAPASQVSDNAIPMAGLGYGLPLARLYAQYFGGYLGVISMHGYGTDAFLYLPFLTTDQKTTN